MESSTIGLIEFGIVVILTLIIVVFAKHSSH
jgi:hypothetical protein